MGATKLHHFAALCVGLTLPLSMPAGAQAAPLPLSPPLSLMAPSAESLEAKAVEAYEAGKFEEAAKHFEAAFKASDDPNYLYNIGRVYEEAGDLEKAMEYYDRFIHAEGVGLDTRMVASERLSQLKKITGQEDTSEPETTSPAETTPPPAEPVENNDGPADDGKEPNKGLVIAGSVLVGVGVPIVLAGAILGGVALRNNDRLESEQLSDPLKAQENGRNQALAADVLIPVGSALAVTGIALLVVNAVRKSRNSSARTALAPSVTRTQAGVSLVGRF